MVLPLRQGCQFIIKAGISRSNLKNRTNFISLRILARFVNSAQIPTRMFHFFALYNVFLLHFFIKYCLVLQYQLHLLILLLNQTKILQGVS